MAYVQSDPRSRLAPVVEAVKKAPTDFAPAYIGRHHDEPPQVEEANLKTWYMRGESFLSAFGIARPGARFVRKGQPDEFVILLPDPETELDIAWEGTTTRAKGYSVVIMPPGDSTIEVVKGGRISQWFTTRSADLVALCVNGADYEHDPNVAPLEPWPDPVGGFKVRVYSLDVPRQEDRFGRLFRCTTFMVNFAYPWSEPRDPSKMSPHDHADHQQCSLILEGIYVHHLRWPWTTDKRKWREDAHEEVGAPSVTFIPAAVIHTSQPSHPTKNQLVDIFCPPRVNFSRKAGWVLNAADYPAKPGVL